MTSGYSNQLKTNRKPACPPGRQPARQALQVWRAAPQVARTVPACRLQGVGPHKVRQPLVMQRLLGGLLLVLPIPCLGVRLLRQVCLWICRTTEQQVYSWQQVLRVDPAWAHLQEVRRGLAGRRVCADAQRSPR